MGIVQTIIIGILFELFLEQVKDIERSLSGLILKSPSVERACMSVQRIHFHRCKSIDDMLLGNGRIVSS